MIVVVFTLQLMCCGGESPNDYRIRGIPESCRRPWLSGVSQMWGCKEVTKRWIKYNTDATAGIGLFVCFLLVSVKCERPASNLVLTVYCYTVRLVRNENS